MTLLDEFKDMSLEQLHAEVGRRQAAKEAERLAGVETDALVSALLEKERVIYGVDDRQDMFAVTDQKLRRDADCVAGMFRSTQVVDNGDGTRQCSHIKLRRRFQSLRERALQESTDRAKLFWLLCRKRSDGDCWSLCQRRKHR